MLSLYTQEEDAPSAAFGSVVYIAYIATSAVASKLNKMCGAKFGHTGSGCPISCFYLHAAGGLKPRVCLLMLLCKFGHALQENLMHNSNVLLCYI